MDLYDLLALVVRCLCVMLACVIITLMLRFGLPFILDMLYTDLETNEEVLGQETLDDNTVVIYVRDNEASAPTTKEESTPAFDVKPIITWLTSAWDRFNHIVAFVFSASLTHCLYRRSNARGGELVGIK